MTTTRDLKRGDYVQIPAQDGTGGFDLARFQSKVKGKSDQVNVKLVSGWLDGKIVRVDVNAIHQATTYRKGSKPSGGRLILAVCDHGAADEGGEINEKDLYRIRLSRSTADNGLPYCGMCKRRMQLAEGETPHEAESNLKEGIAGNGLNYGRGGIPIEERPNPAISQRNKGE